MKAIKTTGKIDKAGVLHLDAPLEPTERSVKVIVLIPEEADRSDADREEQEWLAGISPNSAFDFLRDPQEDIYSANDGKPFHD
jgi:hypothetical protein